MSLASAQVREWIKGEPHPMSISAAAQAAGISRIAFSQQLMRDKVQETVIAGICRSVGLDPLNELASFKEYRDLKPEGPGDVGALAFIDWPELMQAVAWRYRGTDFSEDDLGEYVFPDSSRVWADFLDGGHGTLRGDVAHSLGVSASSVAHALTSGLKPPMAVAFARQAGAPVSSALVVSEVLSPSEAGWPLDARKQAVQSSTPIELLDLVGDRAATALRRERRLSSFAQEVG